MLWWENKLLRVRRNKLYLGGQLASKLAEEHGTPLYVYLKKQIQHNYRTLLKAMQEQIPWEPRIGYAMKANSHPEILKILKTERAWIDAVSPGEVALARNAGFPGNRIFFTGTSLSLEDMQKVFSHNGVTVNIDAGEQLDIMLEAKEKWFKHKTIQVSIRLNPGIGKGFSPKTTTAGPVAPDGTPIKFGIESDKVIPIFEKALDLGFPPIGLHQHLGSGWLKGDLAEVLSAVDRMVEVAAALQKQGHNLEFIDFGGGFGPRYHEEQTDFPVQSYLNHISEQIIKANLNIKAIVLEPGKYLVGDAGILLFKVEYVKKSYGNLFACVNAGTFNTVPRPAIYTQAQHHIVHCTNVKGNNTQKITVAGNLCETGDVFGKEVRLPVPERGDILALLGAGAYCRSMASHYNAREIPKEILV